MNVVPLQEFDQERQNRIFEIMKGRRFLAFTYDKDRDTFQHHQMDLEDHEIIFVCQMMIHKVCNYLNSED